MPVTRDKNIILCGFMGCGKSTGGKLLAQKLKMGFTDMDAYIEAKAGTSIADMFAIYGETYFRQREHEAAIEVSKIRGTVVAAGGGALLYERNSAPLKQSGVIVFLDCGFETCYRRIADSSRPIVRASSKSELETLYNKRREMYLAVSDFAVSSSEKDGALVDKIIELLKDVED